MIYWKTCHLKQIIIRDSITEHCSRRYLDKRSMEGGSIRIRNHGGFEIYKEGKFSSIRVSTIIPNTVNSLIPPHAFTVLGIGASPHWKNPNGFLSSVTQPFVAKDHHLLWRLQRIKNIFLLFIFGL